MYIGIYIFNKNTLCLYTHFKKIYIYHIQHYIGKEGVCAPPPSPAEHDPSQGARAAPRAPSGAQSVPRRQDTCQGHPSAPSLGPLLTTLSLPGWFPAQCWAQPPPHFHPHSSFSGPFGPPCSLGSPARATNFSQTSRLF